MNDPEPLPEPLPEPPAAIPAAPAIVDLAPAVCAARLAELFPAVFTPGAAKPLKLRIQSDIRQRAPGVFTKKSLSVFLHRHTTSNAYLRALVGAPERIDLDGQGAGEIAPEHRQAAQAELDRRRAIHEARRAAEQIAQREARRQARDAELAAIQSRQVDDAARRERAALLRAFETTTLTRTNFCALKRLDEAALDALLAAARQERDQAPRPTAPAAPFARPERVDRHREHASPRPARDERDRGGAPRRRSGPA